MTTRQPLYPVALEEFRECGRDRLRELAESGHTAPVLRSEAADGHAATYAYRGYDFTITSEKVGWRCHGGAHRKGDLLSLCHEAGWFTWRRRRIVRKLGRAIDRNLRAEGRHIEVGA